MVINQGDIFWINLNRSLGSESSYQHPHVVIQNNVFNCSKINTVVVCSLTSNKKLAAVPGNVFLEAGEANLPEGKVVNVSQVFTVEKNELGTKIGTLLPEKVEQIIEGVKLLLTPNDAE